MSRSVRQDYDKLRVRKIGVTIPLPWEAIFESMADQDSRYARKSEPYNVSPTNEDWALYHRAKSGLLALRSYKNTEGLEHVDVPMPKPETHLRFTETAEAWLERCHTLYTERKAA